MTGGHPKSLEINQKLALIAEEFGIGMGVGSQRAALDNENLTNTYEIVRKEAPTAFLISNIGAPQVPNLKLQDFDKIIDMLSANALAIHLNSLQESIQPEGETKFNSFIKSLSNLVRHLKIPVIIKETGAGICAEDAKILQDNGVAAIDVSGVGGTSWSAVEYLRSKNEIGELFWDWGIPTAISLIECLNSTSLPILASGGIRTGVEIAKSLSLGANMVSLSLPLLREVNKGVNYVRAYLNRLIRELKITMYLVGAKQLNDLTRCPIIIRGKTAEWLSARGINISNYANRRF
jgi:isopentenyl-diphosphate delta-isomerase